MKRKILSLILVFAMTVSLLTVGTGAVEPTYGDTAGHWAESSIERWSGHGIIQGSNGLFDPNGQLTCAQLATILAKLLKLPAAKDAGFTDNTADAWYYDAINRCAAAGILNGNGDGTVTPEAPITRERAMVMLARALGIEPIRKPDLTKYTDAAQVSAYAQGYVAALIEAGIVGGVTADELAPQDNITRAATVTILDRAISTYADKAGATVKADGKGIVLVVAENVKITDAPEGTKIVVADGATGLTVNGKSVSDDQTYIVPKTEPAKPSSGSSGGYSHSHSYVYTDNGDGTHTATCYAGDATFTEQHRIAGNQCTLCGAAQTDNSVASVNTGSGYVYYDTLAAAVNAAADGATVTLMKGTEEDITVSGGKALTIDLNGMKLTNKNGDTIVVEIGATLTVTGSGTVDNVTHGKAAIYNNGTVILNGGSYTRSAEASTSIENANGNSYYNILNHGTMTIEENVSVISSGSFSSLIANGYYNFSDTNPRSGHVSGTNQEAPSLTINGGTFSGGINTIKNDDNATLTVNNGSFSNMTQAAIQNNHVATINGGTFDANANHAIENRHFEGGHNTGSVTVTNGVFTGGLYTTAGAAWNITGGTFSSDPSAYVAEGYKATKDESANTWTVKKMDGYVKIEGLSGWYETLTDAAKAWRESKQVVTSGNTFGANSLGTVDSITWSVSGVVAIGNGEGVIGDNGAGQSILGGGYFTPSVTVNSITIKGSNGAKIIKTGDSYLVSAAGQNVVYEDITFVDTVRIDSNPANLTFKNCTFEAGFRMPHSAANGKVTIENCTFTGNESSGYAIFAQGSMASFKVTNSTISNCQRGINVQAGNTAEVTISGNTIENLTGKTENEFTYGSAIQLTSAKTFSVTGNTISDVAVNAFHIYSGCPAVSIEIKDNNISAAYLCWNEANYTNVTSSGNTLNISNAGKCVTKTAEIESTFALN